VLFGLAAATAAGATELAVSAVSPKPVPARAEVAKAQAAIVRMIFTSGSFQRPPSREWAALTIVCILVAVLYC
jgi:hypothetical protein